MKIIKDNLNTTTTEITCPNCNSILEIEPSDVNYWAYMVAFDIRCPVCNCVCEIGNQLPSSFKTAVMNKRRTHYDT